MLLNIDKNSKNVSLNKIRNNELLYLMSCSSSLPGGDRTICNVLIDENEKIIHVYDDLRHCSTSIFKELNQTLIVELMSLLGVEYGQYRIILYYAPIQKNPFIREYDILNEKLITVDIKDINELFYNMALNNEKLKN
ncbi:hypothetical protein [Staphylococcus aureus]|uniref:hypothetical protein n=1 Tax=Staphylococcus aureus TaxID=1280 RepID=UPI000A11179A|nr:hypothetical protein [Staphylococcus aureus]ORN44793.1 hypothetical protein B8A23_01955 [Staphylococcus aureus]HBE8111006.1 hypothetical protein [Staphylococcus aureus]